MELNDKIITGLIAGGVSLVVAIVSYLSTIGKIRHERRNLEKQIKSKFTERLYELRLKHYPIVFEITDKLGKKKAFDAEIIPEKYKQIEKKLREWKSGEVGLILSETSLEVYYELLKAFKAKLALGNMYNDEQLQRFYNIRTEFRNSLRKDLGLLYNLDNKNKTL